ncbi:hypothetical protein HY732_05150 [Candidatus Uhrbacteria bacterium]|nr:hypothetical protein [Candidatus Uhrbacteria bacterium]
MELTKEYLDEKLSGLATKDDLKSFATKDDLKDAVRPLATKADLREGIEELARMVSDGFAEAAKQRDIEWVRRELADVRKVIDRMFDQMDKNAEMRVRHGDEILQLRTRVEKLESIIQKPSVQGA